MKLNYVEIPEGVSVSISGSSIEVKGPKGKIARSFKKVTLKHEGARVIVESSDKAMKGTALSHIRNMVKGVKDGYEVNLEFLHAHFPITLEVKGKDIIIKNFLGEKVSRKAHITGDTKVEVKGKSLHIFGPDKEGVSQTVQNIRKATRIKNRDPRVFQDGFYSVEA
ncbi:MAG: 50S ribosomal protein L6 [Candidatus Anstonellales archaeon]